MRFLILLILLSFPIFGQSLHDLIRLGRDGLEELEKLTVKKLKLRKDLDAPNEHNLTPLQVLIAMGNEEMAIRLLQAGAGYNINHNTLNECLLPIQQAVRYGRTLVVEKIIALGFKVNEQFTGGYTLLHIAAFWNQRIVAEKLVKLGADLELANHQGLTPVQAAINQNNEELGNWLKERILERSAIDPWLLQAVAMQRAAVVGQRDWGPAMPAMNQPEPYRAPPPSYDEATRPNPNPNIAFGFVGWRGGVTQQQGGGGAAAAVSSSSARYSPYAGY